MNSKQIQQKLEAALKLLDQETTTFQKYESIRKLIEGLNPKVDKHLKAVSKAVTAYKKISSGDVIELSAEHLPEKTDQQKKRKRALLLLIQSWTQLKNEVERVINELGQNPQNNSLGENAVHTGKIIKFAKGPFGIITLAAIVIVGFSIFTGGKSSTLGSPEPSAKAAPIVSGPRQNYILFTNKKIPVTELVIRDGPDCDGGKVPHYHAKNDAYVTALDGTQIPDPGSCAYGKVNEVQILSE